MEGERRQREHSKAMIHKIMGGPQPNASAFKEAAAREGGKEKEGQRLRDQLCPLKKKEYYTNEQRSYFFSCRQNRSDENLDTSLTPEYAPLLGPAYAAIW